MVQEFPIYDVIIDDNSLGLTAISLVDEPAIMTDFVAFKKMTEQQMIWMSSREKREIVSPILIPNQLILRQNEQGELYYIRWTADTIRMAAEKYIANGWFNNFTVMHPTFYNKDMKYEDALEKDVYMLRIWTIDNAETDDANTKYGFNLPEGTLMVHFKVHNRKIWQRIKSGELKGVSIEAFTSMIKNNSNVNINVNMNKLDVTAKQMSLFQKFIAFMNEVSAEAEDIADVAKKDETNSGEVSLKYYIDDEHWIEVDAEGFARDTEYNLVAEGEYLLADGSYIVIDSDNKFVETKVGEKSEENEPLEAPIAEEKLKDEDEKKDDEENKEDDSEPKAEGDGEDAEPSDEDKPMGDAEDGEGSDEEDEKKKRVANGELDDEDKKDEEVEVPVEEPIEEPTEEIPSTLVPFEIDGVEYTLPQEVVDFINSLIAAKDSVMSELSLMKERIPSASPIPTAIAQSSEDGESNLFDAIRLLNYKR